MATKYTFEYTDTSKTGFDVFPYTANGPVSPSDSTPIPSAVTATTTLKLYGKGMQEYGEGIEQNLIYLLEHFAGPTAPVSAKEGQIWYDNVGGSGSPPLGPELKVYNSVDWDAIILATGSSPMTGELILSGIPTNPLAAVPLQYVDNHIADMDLHLTSDQNIFLDGLNLPTLTSTEVNYLIGVTSDVQVQLDDKISRQGDIMDPGANLVFTASGSPPANGEVLGLPATPSIPSAATSKAYVDALVLGGAGGDGVLNSYAWQLPPVPPGSPVGSPPPPLPPVTNVDETVLTLTVTFPVASGLPDNVFEIHDISRVGHVHPATDITIDTTGALPPVYGGNVQQALEYSESAKADLAGADFSGPVQFFNPITSYDDATFTVPVSGVDPVDGQHFATKDYVDATTAVVTRTFEQLASDLVSGSPVSPYKVQSHFADDNKLSITINGLKQYVHGRASQQINYYPNTTPASPTGLDHSLTFDFAIAVDGGAPTTITITPTGSPPNLEFHGDLITEINSQLTSNSIDVEFSLNSITSEIFITKSSGGSSDIAITDPATANTYLFQNDTTPDTIIDGEFGNTLGSPSAPDTVKVSGDLTSTYTAGKAFYITNSYTATGESYNGAYRVYDDGVGTGATFDGGSPGITTIPVASIDDSTLIVPLFPAYTGGSPAPLPISYGEIHVTPIVGLNNVDAAISGIEGDYVETDDLGTPVNSGNPTNYVVFNYTIPSGALIETLLLG